MWDCVPDMIIANRGDQHPQDEWNGILNVPCQFESAGKLGMDKYFVFDQPHYDALNSAREAT